MKTDLQEQLEKISDFRDIIHNLDIRKLEDLKIYELIRYKFLDMTEGIKEAVYPDTSKKPTIGIGFNLDRPEAEKEFNEALKNYNLNFHKVIKGKVKLTDEQIHTLYNYSIKVRSNELRKIYGDVFDKLKLNERLAIEDLYFNAPSLVNRNTRFFANIKSYYKNNNVDYLKQALYEVLNRSNRSGIKGLQNRRAKQSEMLNSIKAPFFSRTHSPLYSCKEIEVSLNKTIIPRSMACAKRSNGKYYIWRTMLDYKVRESHLKYEGKVFKKGTLPSGIDFYNCRCKQEELPENIIVAERKFNNISHGQITLKDFIRGYGGPEYWLH